MLEKLVTIIGAGPGGLTLARLLQVRNVAVRLFEHDTSVSSRDQGGSLDLRDDGGQKALVNANLIDEFKKFSRPEGEELKILDMSGKIVFEEPANNANDTKRPEIDRQVLRKLLVDSLKPNTLIWNKHVTSIESLSNGQHKLIFKDGTSEVTDFLIGADGTWSKVRPLLTSVQPTYGGITIIETRISNPEVTSPSIAKLVGHGTVSALGKNTGLLAQRNGDGSIRIYIPLRVPENSSQKYDFTQPIAVKKMLLEEYSDWGSGPLEMLQRSDDYFAPRPLFYLPLERSWTTKPGVTIIGDAAHVMPPFAGQGANLAMEDALELADCLTSKDFTDLASLTEAVKTFEEAMINRARVFSHESICNMNQFIREDGPKGMLDFFVNGYRNDEEIRNGVGINK